MSFQDVWTLCLPFFRGTVVQVEPVEEILSSDAGLLVFRELDEQRQLTAGIAEQLDDARMTPNHSALQLVRSRVCPVRDGIRRPLPLPVCEFPDARRAPQSVLAFERRQLVSQ